MQLSTKSRYAVMAMVDIAARENADRSGELVCLAAIAQRQQLSQSYLEQLFGKLRRAELVSSARGPGGGYRLARPAGEIAIADIVAAVEEPIRATRCTIGSGGCMPVSSQAPAGSVPRGAGIRGGAAAVVSAPVGGPGFAADLPPGGEICRTHDLWSELGRQIGLFLCGISLADVVCGRVIGRAVDVAPIPGERTCGAA